MDNLIIVEHFDRDFGNRSIIGVASSMNNAINMRKDFLNSYYGEVDFLSITKTIGCKDLTESKYYSEDYEDVNGYSGSIDYTKVIINSI
jgi:hypothetical protein